MVAGIESFFDKFRDYPDSYTIIGGAACDILLGNADMEFRITKDIDIILIMEARFPEFVKTFWDYIFEGGYHCGWKNSDKVHFYRFTDPSPGYPLMVELFSREPDYIKDVPQGIIPIHIDDDTSSLSAILLNDDFYDFMLEGRKLISGASVLDAEHLIPFKMYAWLDYMDKKSQGKHVNDRDLKKHKYDVFRLLRIADSKQKIKTIGLVKDSIERFMEEIKNETIPFEQLEIDLDMERSFEILNDIYR